LLEVYRPKQQPGEVADTNVGTPSCRKFIQEVFMLIKRAFHRGLSRVAAGCPVLSKKLVAAFNIGGHHRRGTLFFPALKASVRSVTLIIRDVAKVQERTFSWKVQPK
jgi:hypothetical protein